MSQLPVICQDEQPRRVFIKPADSFKDVIFGRQKIVNGFATLSAPRANIARWFVKDDGYKRLLRLLHRLTVKLDRVAPFYVSSYGSNLAIYAYAPVGNKRVSSPPAYAGCLGYVFIEAHIIFVTRWLQRLTTL
jgi:hypothetical protein